MNWIQLHTWKKTGILLLVAALAAEQTHAGNEVSFTNIVASSRQETNVPTTSWREAGYTRDITAKGNHKTDLQYTYINIIIQVALLVATRIQKAIMKIQQKKMIVEMIQRVSNTSHGLSATADSGTQAARVAKLLQQPEIDYQAYLDAALVVAKARVQTEANLKGAATNKEAAAREADAAAERIYKYNNSREGEDFKSKAENLVLEDAATKLDGYYGSLSKEAEDFNGLLTFLQGYQGTDATPQTQTSSSDAKTTFTADEVPKFTPDMLKGISKEQYAANAAAFTADADAHQKAADATQAFTTAGNEYIKYLDDNKFEEHPSGNAKADELYKNMQTLSQGLTEPYTKIDQTSLEVNKTLNAALPSGGTSAQ